MWLEAGLYEIYIQNGRPSQIRLNHAKQLTKEEVIIDCRRMLINMGYSCKYIVPYYHNGFDRWEIDIFYS